MAENGNSASSASLGFFESFCSGKGGKPTYNSRTTGPKHKQRILCEVRVPGFDYVAAGNSLNKDSAKENAVKDFISYLVRKGEIQQSDVPSDQPQVKIIPFLLSKTYIVTVKYFICKQLCCHTNKLT